MKTALLALVAFTAAPQQPDTPQTPPAQQSDREVYADKQLGLSFEHPKSWVLQKPIGNPGKGKRKPKVDNDTVTFRIPIAGSTQDAKLEIFRAAFNGPSDLWQKIQLAANQNLKREVQQQWEQQVLGVPLLLTRIAYTENGNSESTITGLLYNDWPLKLQFRLTGPSSTFDQAQYEFTQSLETLRTLDNTLPKEQQADATTANPAAPVSKDARGDKHTLIAPVAKKTETEKAPVVVPMTVSTKKVELHLPTGWTATPNDDGSVSISNPEVANPLKVRVAYVADSDAPDRALIKASAASLANFDKVDRREDVPSKANRAGAMVTSVWREGSNAKGALMTVEAVGASGDFYFVLSGDRSTDAAKALSEREAIQALLDAASVEPAP